MYAWKLHYRQSNPTANNSHLIISKFKTVLPKKGQLVKHIADTNYSNKGTYLSTNEGGWIVSGADM